MSAPDAPADLVRLRRVALAFALFVGVLWLLHLLRVATSWDAAPLGLEPLGLEPRTAAGLVGVLTAPLIHGSWGHLLGNSPALLVLGLAMFFGTPNAARRALPLIWLLSGFGVWLFARDAIHIGASGLTFGMLFFVFTVNVLRRDRRSIALALGVAFLYGSMIWGLLPLTPGVSFEYHLTGAVSGLVCAFWLRDRDPLPPRKRYDWEDEADAESGAEMESDEPLFFDERGPVDDDRPRR